VNKEKVRLKMMQKTNKKENSIKKYTLNKIDLLFVKKELKTNGKVRVSP
jgi:hypothetical protein